ncbi:hypothetical protein BUALT_Bualt16G0013300 [Buddleja alternifolia]|uniref:PWWP domain-containing protein n=1 Tax=Buddleja alternifolia TaxID=168488 RepID=A0AAV6WGI3_9LAMI|nr:hypothetical protein BUALT_Bualt16G0013300 [Buddleja alternifolia]
MGDATKITSEDSGALMGGSGSKEKGFDVNKVDYGSAAAAVVSERVVETETVVEATFDSNSELECGLEGKEKIGVENLSSISNARTSVLVNGIDAGVSANASSNGVIASDEKIKDDEGSCAVTVEGDFGDLKKLSGSGTTGFYSNLNGDGKGEGHGEKLEDKDNGFLVGDFVWGKIKSHPWWPGQIYNAKDASEFAVKHKQEGRLLVAFFGDGSCSWCLPSQLIPFVENFEEMSKDSSSKSFLNAVQRAVDEVGRVVELEMICNCIPEEKKEGLARPVVVNAGLKPGVIMPKVDFYRLSIAKHESTELIAKVRQFAKAVSVDNALELAVFRSWLSAFYRFKGGYQMPQYHEPIHIEGLEDENNSVSDVANDSSDPIEAPTVGPMEEYWVPPDVDAANSRALSDDKFFHRRKQKSVAELMGESTIVKPESQKRSKNKDGTDIGKTLKKRKVEISESSEIKNENVLKAENGGVGAVNRVKPREIEVVDAEMASGEAKEELETVSSPRERKLSKYLSPPYTNLSWWMGNSSSKIVSEIGSDKSSKTARSGKRMAEGSGDLFASQSVSKYVDKASEEELPNGQLERPQTVENNMTLSFSTSHVDVPVNELLSEIQSAALDPFYLSRKGSLDMVWEFVTAFRSSTYLHGPDFKIYRKCKAGEKRKSLPSQLGNDFAPKKAQSMKTSKVLKAEGAKVERRALPCLTLSFTSGFPLPSKEDIMRLFGKFGVLNEKKTKVLPDSHLVRIVYMRDSDAEAAFKSSLIESPFGFEQVNYRLKRSSAGSRSRISRPNVCSPLKQTPADDLILDVSVVKRKFEIMTAILENYHSKFSPEDKCGLKDDMRHLREKVETTCDKVRLMAENSSS